MSDSKVLSSLLILVLILIPSLGIIALPSGGDVEGAGMDPPGNALAFDGSDDIVRSVNIGVISEKTISAWVKLDNLTQQGGGLVTIERDDGVVFDAIVYNELGTGWGFGSNSWQRTSWSNISETSTDWIHLAATYANNDYKLYRNGELICTHTSDAVYGFPPNIRIGIGYRHTGGGNNYLKATIDKVRVWNDVLTQTEIKDNMHRALTGSESNLVANYRFDQSSTTTLDDLSSNNYDGTLINMDPATDWVTSNAIITHDATILSQSNIRAIWSANTNAATASGLSLTSSVTGSNRAFFGHDNTTGTSTADLPSECSERAARIWYIDENGTVSADFKFDLSDAAGGETALATDTASQYTLLRRDGTSGAFTAVDAGADDVSGDQVTFNNHAISDGYYTIGYTAPVQPSGEATGQLGAGKDSYSPSETVYVTGSGFAANSTVHVYIVEDFAWSDGDTIPADLTGDGMDIVPTDAAGNIVPTAVWLSPLTVGEYDMVFDADRNGVYNSATDFVDNPNHPGFEVIESVRPVGGEAYPVDILSIVMPWLALTALVPCTVSFLARKRCKTHS